MLFFIKIISNAEKEKGEGGKIKAFEDRSVILDTLLPVNSEILDRNKEFVNTLIKKGFPLLPLQRSKRC